ncbi:hypothetical protein [Pseudodesulfovibrio sp.]|uniref:hypothetical protein n=1 Tax=unclassified Pseudodesulfovibrio TaxID=2661612 RepID=UPI003B00E119
MHDISARSVLRQSVAMMWRQRLAVLGFLVVQAVFYGAFSSLGLDDPERVRDSLNGVGSMAFGSGAFFFSVMGMVIYLLYNHYAVTALRGEPMLLPLRPLFSLARFVWTCIKIGLVTMVLGGIIAVPPSFLALGFPQLRDNPVAIVGVVVYAFAALFWLLFVTLRLQLAVPGSVVGDGITLREALRISRGRSWRMLCSVILLILAAAVAVVVFFLPLVFIPGVPSLLRATALSMLNGLFGLLSSTLLCAWYVRLADGRRQDGEACGGEEAPCKDDSAGENHEEYYAAGADE